MTPGLGSLACLGETKKGRLLAKAVSKTAREKKRRRTPFRGRKGRRSTPTKFALADKKSAW